MANVPPEPPMPPDGSGSGEYARWKKRHAEWSRWMRDNQTAQDATEGQRAAHRQEEQHIRADDAWAEAARSVLGEQLADIEDGLRNAPSDADVRRAREVFEEARRAAQGGVFRRANPQKARRILKSNKGKIKGAAKKGKKGWCSLVVVLGVAYAALLAAVVGSGAHDLWASVVSR